jgi:hypothetical protein
MQDAAVRKTSDTRAIHRLAPTCEHCRCRILGHGTQVDGRMYCCAHCARQAAGTDAVADRVGA